MKHNPILFNFGIKLKFLYINPRLHGLLMRWNPAECGWVAECGWYLAECGWDLAEWFERLIASVEVATVLGSIPASSDSVESEGRQMKKCWLQYIEKKIHTNPLLWIGNKTIHYTLLFLIALEGNRSLLTVKMHKFFRECHGSVSLFAPYDYVVVRNIKYLSNTIEIFVPRSVSLGDKDPG